MNQQPQNSTNSTAETSDRDEEYYLDVDLLKAKKDTCECEQYGEAKRIECLVNSYRRLLKYRRLVLPLNIEYSIKSCNRLSNLTLVEISDDENITKKITEFQIFHTFIKRYSKTHPKFIRDGPDLGDIVLTSNFYQST